jgi:glycosyltransferase involved in cell wall biosynthesis
MKKNPKVSVFIASYNHAPYLPECLDSILAQTYRDFEIVIVDDGSTDESPEIIRSYQRQYPDRVFYYTHPGHENKGISASCNLAISKSRGEYLAWIGSDDAWFLDKLELQVKLLDDFPQYGLVYGYAQNMNESGKILPRLIGKDITLDVNPLGCILQSCSPPAMTIMIRRGCLEEVGLFDEDLVNSDWELIIRISAHWKLGFIDKPLAKYRLHSSNVSKGIDPKILLERYLEMYQAVSEKASKIGGAFLIPRNQALLSLQLAFHYYCDGKIEEAAKSLSNAFDEAPSLSEDIYGFNEWLNRWKPAFYNTTLGHFGFWTIVHLPHQINRSFRSQLTSLQLNNPDTRKFFIRRGIERDLVKREPIIDSDLFGDCPNEIPLTPTWKHHVLSELYPELLFKNYKIGNLSKTRYYWGKTIGYNPTWLKNRGVLSIGFKAFLKPY